MQLFNRKQEEDPDEFWQKTAERRGGQVGFLTFATLLGRAGDRPMELPGLLYVVGDMIWFEDFERDNWLARIIGGKRKFEKTELSFGRAEIRVSRLVSRSAAMRCIGGGLPVEHLHAVSSVARIFTTPIVQVTLDNGTTLFFDMIRRLEFVSEVAGGAAAAAPRP